MQIEVNDYILEVPDDYTDAQIEQTVRKFADNNNLWNNQQTQTRPDSDIKPDEAFYGAQNETDLTGLPSVPKTAQIGPQEPVQASQTAIDTSYRPITLGERFDAWWNDKELRDPGIDPNAGKTAQQIYEEQYGAEPESPMLSESDAITQSVIDNARQADLTRKMVVRELLDDPEWQNKPMDEIEKEAKYRVAGNALQTVALALSLKAPVRPGVIGGASSGAGYSGMSELANQWGRALAGEEKTDDAIAADVIDEMITGAQFGGAVGGVSKVLGEGSEWLFRKAKDLAPKNLEELNRLGSKGSRRYEGYLKEQTLKREELQNKVINGEMTLEEASIAFKKFNDTKWKSKMMGGIEDTNINASDILAAKNKANELFSNPNLRSGTETVAEQIDNPALRKILSEVGVPIVESGKMSRSKNLQEFLGLRTPGLFRDRMQAVKDETVDIFNQASALKQGIGSGGTKEGQKVGNKMLDEIKRAASSINKGEMADAKKALDAVNELNRTKGLALSSESQATINNLKAQLQTLRKVKATGKDTNVAIDTLKKFAPSIIGGGVGLYGSEGSWERAMALAAVGAGARGAVSKLSSKAVANRLGQVRKALGGNYKIDREAEEMIRAGHDVATVITGIVLRAQAYE